MATSEFDFFELVDVILESPASTAEKLLALVIGRHIGKVTGAAFPSRARMMQLASMSLSTLKRCQPAIKIFYDVEERLGRTTIYVPKAISADEIEAAIRLMRENAEIAKPAIKTKTRGQNDTDPFRTRYQDDATTRGQNDTGVGVKMTPHNKLLNELVKKEDSSLRSESASADASAPESADKVLWGKAAEWLAEKTGKPLDGKGGIRSIIGKWQKTLTPYELLPIIRSAHAKHIPGNGIVAYVTAAVEKSRETLFERCRRENGRIVVMNGFRAELGEILAGRDLPRELDKINGKIGQHVIGVDLEARVRALALEMVDEDAKRDQRYRSAVESRTGADILNKPKFQRTEEEDALAFLMKAGMASV